MTKTKNKLYTLGFTLIELLIVITIIAILLIVSLVALKPAQRLADARDSRRATDLNQILTGIHSCIVDSDSGLSTCLGSYTVGDTYEIVSGSTSTGCDDVCTGVTSDTHCLALDTTLTDYFTSLPTDPSTVTSGHTEYSIRILSNNMTVLESCSAEGGTMLISR